MGDHTKKFFNISLPQEYNFSFEGESGHFTSTIDGAIERLRDSKISVVKIANFFSGLDSNKNGLVSKTLDNSN